MKKKVISVVLLVAFILSLSVPTFADQTKTKKVKLELHPPNGVPFKFTDVYHTPVSNSDVHIDGFGWWHSRLEAWWSSWSGAYATATSDAFTDSTEKTRYSIDYIWAKARIYVDGGLKAQDADTQTNASHAGITVNYSGSGSYGATAYGNHEYRESGYQTVTDETGPLTCE